MMPNRTSILIIGATGRTGAKIAQALFDHSNNPQISALCRSPSKVDDKQMYNTVIQGDARSPNDLKCAIEQTDADVVVVAVGNGDNLNKTDTRTASAKALVQVLQQPQCHHVKVFVVSSNGTYPSRIKIGMGMGKLIQYHLRHVLRDHEGQEKAFACVEDRCFIVRPTALTDDKTSSRIVDFADLEKPPSIHIDRSDVARYMVTKILDEDFVPATVNITGTNKKQYRIV